MGAVKPGELLGAGAGGGGPRDGLVSHPGGSSDTRGRFMLRKPWQEDEEIINPLGTV